MMPVMQGRLRQGQGLVFDEAYQFLQDTSILDGYRRTHAFRHHELEMPRQKQ